MGGESVPLNYIPIAIFAVIALGFGVVSLVVGWIVRPSRPYRAKLLPYESGSPLFMDARVQFPMRYYIIAMLFVVFDIEIRGVSQTGIIGPHRNGGLHRHPGRRVLVRLEKRGIGMGLRRPASWSGWNSTPRMSGAVRCSRGGAGSSGVCGCPSLSFPRHRLSSRAAVSTRDSIFHAAFA